jgi:hypothetical protein
LTERKCTRRCEEDKGGGEGKVRSMRAILTNTSSSKDILKDAEEKSRVRKIKRRTRSDIKVE